MTLNFTFLSEELILVLKYVNKTSWHPGLQFQMIQNVSGRGLLSKNDLNSISDLSGCENGASWEAPLMVAKERILPYT